MKLIGTCVWQTLVPFEKKKITSQELEFTNLKFQVGKKFAHQEIEFTKLEFQAGIYQIGTRA